MCAAVCGGCVWRIWFLPSTTSVSGMEPMLCCSGSHSAPAVIPTIQSFLLWGSRIHFSLWCLHRQPQAGTKFSGGTPHTPSCETPWNCRPKGARNEQAGCGLHTLVVFSVFLTQENKVGPSAWHNWGFSLWVYAFQTLDWSLTSEDNRHVSIRLSPAWWVPVFVPCFNTLPKSVFSSLCWASISSSSGFLVVSTEVSSFSMEQIDTPCFMVPAVDPWIPRDCFLWKTKPLVLFLIPGILAPEDTHFPDS